MIVLRRNTERRHIQTGKNDTWLTFYQQDGTDPLAQGFCALEALDEKRLTPGGSVEPHPRGEAEIVTYLFRGALAQEDSTGRSCVIRAGEFQYMTAERRVSHGERNASQTDPAHVFRMSLRSSESELGCPCEQKLFSVAERRGVLHVVASPDGRKGSLRIRQDARIYSSVLNPGHHIIHELMLGRSAWLHVIYGEANLQGIVLTQGDGVGVTIEPAVSFTALEKTEILLVDLGPAQKSFTRS